MSRLPNALIAGDPAPGYAVCGDWRSLAFHVAADPSVETAK